MTVRSHSSRRPVRPSENGSETLIEYIQAVEPDPLPIPLHTNILEVLTSVYADPPAEKDAPVIKIASEIVPPDSAEFEPGDSSEAVKNSKITIGFKLACSAVILSVFGWLSLFVFPDDVGILFTVIGEFLAVCFALGSFTCSGEQKGTRSLGWLAMIVSVGWIPLILLLVNMDWEILTGIFALTPIAFGFVIIGLLLSYNRRENDGGALNLNN